MFPVQFVLRLVAGICRGIMFSARNIPKCRLSLSSSPTNGLLVSKYSEVVDYLSHPEVKHAVVLAGAGISTPCGIPDFRSPGTGLYNNLKKYHLPYPEAIFDIDYFHFNQKPFFLLAKEIFPGNFRPGVAHYFMRLLCDKEKLQRIYTQNIDGLERMAGIPPSKLVEAHGTFHTATCQRCGMKYDGEFVKKEIIANRIPRCMGLCKGVVKPDITFFGELLSDEICNHPEDFNETDLMIIMGTALKVQPFSSLAYWLPKDAPRLLLNKENVLEFPRKNDIFVQGDLKETVPELAKSLGWSTALKQLMSEGSSM